MSYVSVSQFIFQWFLNGKKYTLAVVLFAPPCVLISGKRLTHLMFCFICSYLYVCLDLREEIDKFDVGRQEKGAGAERAEMVLRVKQPELEKPKFWNQQWLAIKIMLSLSQNISLTCLGKQLWSLSFRLHDKLRKGFVTVQVWKYLAAYLKLGGSMWGCFLNSDLLNNHKKYNIF